MAQSSDTPDVCCVLCMKSVEDKDTGPLSTKDNVSAHQNCLLYASGIYSKNSPTYHDLFGFEVDDVLKEVRRGKRLKCSLCTKIGATVGCEKKSCKRSYHYPCALKDKAVMDEDDKEGIYRMFCSKHQVTNNGNSVNISENSHGGIECSSGNQRFRVKKRMRQFTSSDDSDLDDIIHPMNNRQSTPVPEDECTDNEEPNRSIIGPGSVSPTTGASHEYIDSDPDSQSLLPSEYRKENVPFTVIGDSGPSVTSDTSPCPLSPSSPFQGAPVTYNSPQFHSGHEQEASNHNDANIIANSPVSPCLDSLSPNNTDAELGISFVREPSFKKPRLVELPVSKDFENISHNLHGSTSTDYHNHPLNLTAQAMDSSAPSQVPVPKSDSNSAASLFWMKCNEVGFTESIFTQLKHKLDSLADKVQNKHATQEDYVVALGMLKMSGMLQTVLNQLEQDLHEQEEKLRRRREALKIAREALNENNYI